MNVHSYRKSRDRWHVWSIRGDRVLSTVVPESGIADLFARHNRVYKDFYVRHLPHGKVVKIEYTPWSKAA